MKIKRGFSKKGYLQISFAWLFALIVGAFILFIAIFAVMKITKTSEVEIDVKTAREIEVLLQPLETSFETGTTSYMVLPSETRIYNACDNEGFFGRQLIKISQKSFGKWTDSDINTAFRNKYIFSENYIEGKKFHLFSKPFRYPFKISDVIILTSDSKEYCFVNAPENIKNEVLNFQENIKAENCSESSLKVCFGNTITRDNCDSYIFYNNGRGFVEKEGEKMLFVDDGLMFGAIFSDKDIYECQVKRLMQRAVQLSLLYMEKASLVAQKNCNSDLNSELSMFKNLAENFKTSEDFNLLNDVVEDIEEKHDSALCRLW